MIVQNRKFKPLYTTDKRYILLTGGRGGAKSFEATVFGTKLTYELGQRILFTRYTMTSAEISIIPEFKEKIQLLEVERDFKVNATDIVNKLSGCEILFRGIKTSSGLQTANLKSIAGITTWVNDESEELVSEDIFDTIDLSIRKLDVQNTVVLILNPSHKDHWIYKRWIKNTKKIIKIDGYPVEISTHPEVLHIHTTYLDNLKNLNEKFVANLIAKKNSKPKYYGHKVIGQWSDVAEGSIFPSDKLCFYKPSKAIEKEFEGCLAYIDVADEGTDFTCMVIGKNIKDTIYIVDVVFSDLNSDATIPMCIAALKKNKVSYCRVESNSMGGMYGKSIQKEYKDCEILYANSSTNKHTRILMDAPFIYEHFMFIHEQGRDAMYEEYMIQLGNYTKDGEAEHDDAADASSGLAVFCRSMLTEYFE